MHVSMQVLQVIKVGEAHSVEEGLAVVAWYPVVYGGVRSRFLVPTSRMSD